MNRSEELKSIDDAITITKNKISEREKEDYILEALSLYLKQNFSRGFTRTNNARSIIESLKKSDIEKELLKNIIKVRSLSVVKGYPIYFRCDKNYKDTLTLGEAEALISQYLKELSIDDIKYMLDLSPNLYEAVVASFVNRRYFNPSYGKDDLDDLSIINYDSQEMLDKIDYYYENNRSLR